MTDSMEITYNKDNDKKYLNNMLKRKKNTDGTNIDESVNTDNEEIQYFTE
jgi:hypothetical protein